MKIRRLKKDYPVTSLEISILKCYLQSRAKCIFDDKFINNCIRVHNKAMKIKKYPKVHKGRVLFR